MSSKPVKTCTLNGTKYDVMVGGIDGMCEKAGPGDPNLVIAMEPADTHRFMETVIHEALHGCSFSKSEELVTVTARDITRLLRRLGFKWVKDVD